MDPFEQQLTDSLHRSADGVTVRPGGLDVTRRRARRMQLHRRRAAVASGALLSVSALVGGVVILNGSDRNAVTIGDTPNDSLVIDNEAQDPTQSVAPPQPDGVTSGDTPAAPAGLGPSPFTWEQIDSNVPNAFTVPVTLDQATGALYSVSTQPGRAVGSVDLVPIRSTDGASWEPVGLADQVAQARNLAAYDGALYSVGTAPITAPIADGEDWGDIVTRTSLNGVDWTTELLPGVDIRAIRQQYGGGFSRTAAIAAGPEGAILAQQIGAFPDIAASAAGIDLIDGYQVVEDGLLIGEASGANGEEGRHRLVSWDELGASAADIALYKGHPRFFVSRAGGGFGEVTVPFDPVGVTETVSVLADNLGFAVAVKSRATDDAGKSVSTTVEVFTSADGYSWTAAPPLEGVNFFDSLYRIDGQLTAVAAQSGYESELFRLTSGTWEPLGLTSVVETMRAPLAEQGFGLWSEGGVFVGPSGIAKVVDAYADPLLVTPVTISHDEYSLEFRSTNAWVVVDGSGNDVGAVQDSGRWYDGPVRYVVDADDQLGVEVAVYSDGDVELDRFTSSEIVAAVPVDVLEPTTLGKQFILFSGDNGASWSATELSEVVGDGALLTSLILTNDGIVIEAQEVTEAQPAVESSGEPVTTDAPIPARRTYRGRLG
jgi:hypothetical protein